MKFYCYTRVDGYKRFCISHFRKSDDGRFFYIFMDDIAKSKLNPQTSVYVTRENLCGLSENSARLFTYAGCKLLTKLDDGESPTEYTQLYIRNVGNATQAASNNQSKSFIIIAESKEEDALLRKLSCLYATNDKQISDLTYSLAYRSILDEKVIFCFDNDKWNELTKCLNKKDVSNKYNEVLYGKKYLCVCDGASSNDFFAEFGLLSNQDKYIIEEGKKKDIYDKNKIIFLILSVGTIALLGYLMLKK